MSVGVRPYKRGGWLVDICLKLPDGSNHRDRKVLKSASKSAAQRWGQERERHLLRNGPPKVAKEVPTFEEFVPRFLELHVLANRHKPSGIAAKKTILQRHLIPMFGSTRLDAISTESVQSLKKRLQTKAPKTVNNILAVLGVLLKKATEWGAIEAMPCAVRLVRVPKLSRPFHNRDDYERLVEAASRLSPETHLLVLLGGDAGLRLGEMMALEWDDLDLLNRRLCVQQSEWKGHVTSPKGGRLRHVPMTERLAAAMRGHRNLRGRRVLLQANGSPMTMKIIQDRVAEAARKASVRGGVHILRHTFCSHLAMSGIPAGSIQALAGHEDLKTTQGYMHLNPEAVEAAIRLLDASRTGRTVGNPLATGAEGGR